jgi:nitronate monooxygenase
MPASRSSPIDPVARIVACRRPPREPIIRARAGTLCAAPGERATMAALSTRLTRALGLRHPVVGAPMAFAAGGALAAAVSRAGGLGIIGGGYGDPAWLDEQFAAAQGERVGVGFITWSLRKAPSILAGVLRHRPAAVMLSFGDPRPFVEDIRAAGALLICQCQDLEHVLDAVDVGADIVVAQGADAGGIADGRGLAAALVLGADGVLVGTRLWASREALVKPRHHEKLLAASGDGTLRTRVPDIVRQLPWPRGFTARVARNAFTERWHGHEDELEHRAAAEAPAYRQAFEAGDPEHTAVWFGEAAGLIGAIEPAATIVERLATEAAARLAQHGGATLA